MTIEDVIDRLQTVRDDLRWVGLHHSSIGTGHKNASHSPSHGLHRVGMVGSGVLSVWHSPWTRWTLAATAVVCGLGWWLQWYPRDTQWTAVIDTLTAVGTLGALAVAVYLAGQSSRAKKRQHASQLSWWTDRDERPEAGPAERTFLDHGGENLHAARYDKAGPPHRYFVDRGDEILHGAWYEKDENVSGVVVYAYIRISNASPTNSSNVWMWAPYSLDGPLLEIGTLPAGFIQVAVARDWGATPTSRARAIARIGLNLAAEWVQFEDANGGAWRRNRLGRPEPRSADSLPTFESQPDGTTVWKEDGKTALYTEHPH